LWCGDTLRLVGETRSKGSGPLLRSDSE
jgi:hypothetical protein